MRTITALFVAALLVVLVAPVGASVSLNAPTGVTVQSLYVSIGTTDSQLFGTGTTYKAGDIIKIDVASGTSSRYFQGSTHFSQTEDIDAISLTGDGKIILSTVTAAYLNGIGTFQRGDLVLYNPTTNTSSLFFKGSTLVHCTDPNVDACALLDDGTLLFSVAGGTTFNMDKIGGGAITFDKDDIVAYKAGVNPYVWFDGGAHGISGDIDALAFLPNGDFVFSLASDASSIANSKNEDLILYSMLGHSFSLFLDSSAQLCYSGNIDALDITATWAGDNHQENPVPEPVTCVLFGLSVCGGLAAWRRRKI